MPYEIRYVAFIDILGFSEIVSRTTDPKRENTAVELAKILNEIGIRDRRTDEILGDDFRFQTFSDSIIISERTSPDGLLSLLETIAEIAEQLLHKGLLIRGGLAKGSLHHDDRVIFGPAFLEAHMIENSIAKFPRVVLSKAVYEDALSMVENCLFPYERIREMIKISDDGPAFVHTLEDSLYQSQNWTTIPALLRSLLRDAMHIPSHYEKVRWFAIYWNGTVIGTNTGLDMVPLADQWPPTT